MSTIGDEYTLPDSNKIERLRERYLEREFGYSKLESVKCVANFGGYMRKNELETWKFLERLHCLEQGLTHKDVRYATNIQLILTMEWMRDHQDMFRMWVL